MTDNQNKSRSVITDGPVLGKGSEQLSVAQRARWTWNDILVMTMRSLTHIKRSPELLIFSTIQPVMFVLLFRYVFGGAIDIKGTTYVNFLMAGIFVQTVAFGSMTTGVSLAQDLESGLVDRLLSLPMSRSAVLIGRTVADLVRNVGTVVVMLAVGLLVGFRPDGGAGDWLLAFAMLLLFSFALSWISAWVALGIRSVEAVQSAGFIWLFPLTFACSAFVETSSMPGGLRAFADNQPVTHVVDAIRSWTLGTPVGNSAWLALVWCLAITAVFVPLAIRSFRHNGVR